MSKEEIKFNIGYDDVSGVMPVPQFAALAERLGFDGITTSSWGMGLGAGYDPFVVLSQAAASTEHLLLSTSVLLPPLIHPLILAQQVATLDTLSQGRVILGVGVGGERPRQFQALGIPLSERGVRTNEAIEILQGLWTQPTFSYHGRIYNFDDISLDPKPIQKPHPPIWIGGRIGGVEIGPDGERRFKSKTGAIRRTARYGDGWIPIYMTVEMYQSSVEQIKAFAKEFGRETHPITMAHHVNFLIRDTHEEALQEPMGLSRFGEVRGPEFAGRYDILGSPKDCIKRLEEYIDVGVTHFMCRTTLPPNELRQQMERLAREVVPYFK